MKVEKVFCIGKKHPAVFGKEVIDYIVDNYGCDRDIAGIRLHYCLLSGWSLCETQKGIIEIWTNPNRSEIKIEQY